MVSGDINRPPLAPHPASDEFDGPTLDPKWTVVEGAAGTVDLTATGGGVYDLSTRPGWLLLQPDTGQPVRLRQDWTLPDGQSVVACLAPCLTANAQSGITDGALDLGIAVSSRADDWHAGDYATVHVDSEENGWRVYGGGGIGGDGSIPSGNGRAIPTADLANLWIARRLYLRILRLGLSYYTMFSGDGATWLAFAPITLPQPATTLWLFAQVDDAIPDPTPIQAVDWVRVGGAGVDPW